MCVAFVPAVAVAALILIFIRGRGAYMIRFLNLSLASVVGFIVAATWYWRNSKPVYEYLTNFGYGSQSQYYGTEHSPLSWSRFKAVADNAIYTDLLVPLAILILTGLTVLTGIAVKRLVESKNRRATLLRIAGSDTFAVLVVYVVGFAALMSSRNGGDGFTFPLSMLLPPLAVVALRYQRRAVVPILALVSLIGAVNLLATSDLSESLSQKHLVNIPLLGELPWVNGQPHALAAIRVQLPGPPYRFVPKEHRWVTLDDELATLLASPIGPGHTIPVVAVASRNRVINTNSVGVASLLDRHVGLVFTQLTAEPNDTIFTYERELTAPQFGGPTALLTMSSEQGDFPPLVTQSKAEAAARLAGFHEIRRFSAPDGRYLYVWIRTKPAVTNG